LGILSKVSFMLKYLFVALFVAVFGAGLVLAFWHIPAPTKTVETVIPNDKFKF